MRSTAKIFVALLILVLQLTSCSKNVSNKADSFSNECSYPFEPDFKPQNIIPNEDIMLVEINDFRQVFDKQLEYDYDGLISPMEIDTDLERIYKRDKENLFVFAMTDYCCIYSLGNVKYRYDFVSEKSTPLHYNDRFFLTRSIYPIYGDKLYYGGLRFLNDESDEERQSVIYTFNLETNEVKIAYSSDDDRYLSEYYGVLSNGYIVAKRNRGEEYKSLIVINPDKGEIIYESENLCQLNVIDVYDNRIYAFIGTQESISLKVFDDKLNCINEYIFSQNPKDFNVGFNRMVVYGKYVYWTGNSLDSHIYYMNDENNTLDRFYENQTYEQTIYCTNYDNSISSPLFWSSYGAYVSWFDENGEYRRCMIDLSNLDSGYALSGALTSEKYCMITVSKHDGTSTVYPTYRYLINKSMLGEKAIIFPSA